MSDGETSPTVCPKCGARMDAVPLFLAGSAAYCASCGAYPLDERRRKNTRLAVALASVAVMAGIIALVVFPSRNQKTSPHTKRGYIWIISIFIRRAAGPLLLRQFWRDPLRKMD